nr:maleylpyruvate isomerase family mycothiol-dependent enzyme [Micromonospora sp. DSM 115978]
MAGQNTSIPTIGPADVAPLATTENRRFADLLHALGPDDWTRPTDCAAWDVRRLVAHVVGATEANASPREMVRQLRHGRVGVAVAVDPVATFQVAQRDHVSVPELVARFDKAVPGAVRWRSRLVRRTPWVPFRVGAPVHETWRLRYLAGTVYTRDTWMHRIDVCRATGRVPALTAEHDGLLVADAVAEWVRRHGRSVRLTLTGPAGGKFRHGTDGPELVSDAVEFCRRLSGRGEPPLATPVPF